MRLPGKDMYQCDDEFVSMEWYGQIVAMSSILCASYKILQSMLYRWCQSKLNPMYFSPGLYVLVHFPAPGRSFLRVFALVNIPEFEYIGLKQERLKNQTDLQDECGSPLSLCRGRLMKKHAGKKPGNIDAAVRRRLFLGVFSSFGLAGTLLPGALAAVAGDSDEITPEMAAAAERVAGFTLTKAERRDIIKRLNALRARYESMRAVPIHNSVPLALVFNPVPAGMRIPRGNGKPFRIGRQRVPRPASEEELAFLPVTSLSRLIEARTVRSTELTRIYLSRLKKYDPLLHCVVTLTEDLALRQAGQADREIAAGKYRGLLHGIPWGVKDLFAVKGYLATVAS